MPTTILPYIRLIFGLALVYFFNLQAHGFHEFLAQIPESHLLESFFVISLVFAFSFVIYYLSDGTMLPSFVVAIFFGLVSQNLLAPIVHQESLLAEIVGLGATLILFGGGLETPWLSFKKLLLKILSLSFIGLFLTALLFSLLVLWISNLFGLALPVPVAVLLGAVLASTDPAAIIPVLKGLRFHKRDTKDIIVSESAMTDVTGTLLTVVFLSLLAAGVVSGDVGALYQQLFTAQTAGILAKQIAFGILFGVLGYGLLEFLSRFKREHDHETEVDAAYFLFVPVIIFTVALIFGGSGYLAAFVAGLLFVMTEKLHVTEKFFNHIVDGFLKPTIFLLLGALVDVNSLVAYAPVGLLAALVFMFVIRPLSVFVSLAPFMLFGKDRPGYRELLFISFVRETGAIPAVLLVTIISSGLSGLEGLVPVGMWVILATLILQPPLTPMVAKWLHVAVPIQDTSSVELDHEHSFVLLGSRGNSYKARLPLVADWASIHDIKLAVLLHCLEGKYSEASSQEAGIEAEAEFARINTMRSLKGKKKIRFVYVSREGFLQKNIEDLAKEYHNLVAVFVGKKILDFQMSDVKAFGAPIYFMD